MSYGRCVVCSFAGEEQEVIEKCRRGILPIFKSQPGFLAYGSIFQDGKVVSMSARESQADAEAADDVARESVKENLDATVLERYVGDTPGSSSGRSHPLTRIFRPELLA